MNNPEDPNELDIYKRLTDIERRLDQLDENHRKLREDYLFNRGGRRKKTRRKKNQNIEQKKSARLR